jgi:hypothetical protein
VVILVSIMNPQPGHWDFGSAVIQVTYLCDRPRASSTYGVIFFLKRVDSG